MAGAHMRSDRAGVKADLEMAYGMFPAIQPVKMRKCGYCSGGEQQMTAVGRALMARPKILLLDEASLGLAPITIREIYDVVRQINQELGVSIVLVEQNAAVALEAADYAYVMENGRIVKDGTSAELKDNKDIQQFYLGLTEMVDKETGEMEKRSFKDVKHYKRRKRWL